MYRCAAFKSHDSASSRVVPAPLSRNVRIRIARDNAGVISRNDFVRNGSPQIQRSLRGLRVLTQGLPRGPRTLAAAVPPWRRYRSTMASELNVAPHPERQGRPLSCARAPE
jgi:hypothetical protein